MLQGQFTDLQQYFLEVSCCHVVDASWALRLATKRQNVLGDLKGLFGQRAK